MSWKLERVGWHPSNPSGILILSEGEEAICRYYLEILKTKWQEGWMRSHGSVRLLNPSGKVVEEILAPRPEENK